MKHFDRTSLFFGIVLSAHLTLPNSASARDQHHGSSRDSHHDHHRYHHHGYSYRSYPFYYSRPFFGFSFTTTPRYYAPEPRYYRRSDDMAVDVQVSLRRRGYYRGEIDGDVGPETRSAIRRYQYDRRLPVSGQIDGPLLRSLGIG